MTMSEDELLDGIMDALLLRRATSRDTVAQHVRRSDRAQLMGLPGIPDIVGVVGSTLIAWELKADAGRPSLEQWEWLAALQRVDAIDVRLVTPADLDPIIDQLLAGVLLGHRRVIRP